MSPSENLENKILPDTYWRFQLISMAALARSSLEPPVEYSQDQMPLTNQGLLTFLTNLKVKEISCSFRLVLRDQDWGF